MLSTPFLATTLLTMMNVPLDRFTPPAWLLSTRLRRRVTSQKLPITPWPLLSWMVLSRTVSLEGVEDLPWQ